MGDHVPAAAPARTVERPAPRAPGRRDRLLDLAAAVSLVAVAAWAYGYTLALPLFLDDLVHFRWLEGRALASVWRSAEIIGYYRPLTFTLWRLLRLAQGWYHPPTLHAVNLALHAGNALLLAALLRRPAGRLAGWAAAVLFLLFPFSYQAVPWVGSLSHILVTSLTLASLYAALRGWRVASLALAALAPFAHETGVLVAPLLALWRLVAEGGRGWRALLRETAPYWFAAGVGFLAWLLAPKSVGETGILNLESRWQNAAYFAQGLAFPMAPLSRMLLARSPFLNDLGAIALVAAPAVAAWTALLRRAGRGRAAALGLGWYAVAIGPAWLVLGFSYVVDGPRLMYGAAAGAAIFWAAPLGLLAEGARAGRRLLGLAGALAVLAGVYVGGRFLHSRADLYMQMAHATEGLVRAAEGVPAGGRLLVLNSPWWIAPRETMFALGHEGVTLVPPYTSTGDLLWLHTGVERQVQALTAPALRREWRHWYTCDGPEAAPEALAEALRASDGVALVDYAGRDIVVLEAGARLPDIEAEAWLAEYDGLRLAGARAEPCPEGLRVVLEWWCLHPPAEDVTVFLHAVDGAGALIGQRDGYPLAGASPPRTWLEGEGWRDVRIVPLLPGAEPTALLVGLYRTVDGGRIPAQDASGAPLPEGAFRVLLPPAP